MRKKSMNNAIITVEQLVADYSSGRYSIAMLSEKYGISVGKTYNMLNRAGCAFTRKRRKPVTEQERINRSNGKKGKKLSAEHIAKIRKFRSCDYNGLNGFGHQKAHNLRYVLVYVPHHPNAHKDGYVMLHTVLMERHIGRYLAPDEVVHHINRNRSDNRLENLELMKKAEHTRMHLIEVAEKRRANSCKKSS